jgi:plastocyanin
MCNCTVIYKFDVTKKHWLTTIVTALCREGNTSMKSLKKLGMKTATAFVCAAIAATSAASFTSFANEPGHAANANYTISKHSLYGTPVKSAISENTVRTPDLYVKPKLELRVDKNFLAEISDMNYLMSTQFQAKVENGDTHMREKIRKALQESCKVFGIPDKEVSDNMIQLQEIKEYVIFGETAANDLYYAENLASVLRGNFTEEDLKNEIHDAVKDVFTAINDDTMRVEYTPSKILNLEDQDYGISVINKLGGNGDNTMGSIQYNSKYLNENYDRISKIPNIDMNKIDNYKSAASIAVEDMYTPNDQRFHVIVADGLKNSGKNYQNIGALNYNGNAAAAYANSHWSKNLGLYAKNYPDWSTFGDPGTNSDCANFASQCLNSGGLQYNIAEANATTSTSRDVKNWYSYGTKCLEDKVSKTHRGTGDLRTYMINTLNVKESADITKNRYSANTQKVKPGDIIIFLENGNTHHTAVVVGTDANEIYVAAHTDDVQKQPVSSYFDHFTSFRYYNIK